MSQPLAIVTGFGAFLDVRSNPTELLVRTLEAEGLGGSVAAQFQLFDTAYDAVSRRLPELLALRPAALVLTGYSRHATRLTLERRATSRRSAEHADATGVVAGAASEHGAIDNASVDFSSLMAKLDARGIPAELSDDAGDYVCNHCYFEALSAIRREALSSCAVFVHIPGIAGMEDGPEGAGEMSLAQLTEGIRLIARALAGAA